MLRLNHFRDFRWQKFWILGILWDTAQNGEKTCAGPTTTIMQNFTLIGVTVAEVRLHTKNQTYYPTKRILAFVR